MKTAISILSGYFGLICPCNQEKVLIFSFSRKATIRLHGYNDEMEVPVEDLEVSLGQDAVDQQIADAEAEEVGD